VIFDLLRKNTTPITDSASLARYLSAGNTATSGVSVTPQSAMTLPWVFACVRVLAESVSLLPIAMHRKIGRVRSSADDHPLHELLAYQPNSFQTSDEFWSWVTACQALRGAAYAYPVRVRGEVRELLPINPGIVTPRMLADGGTVVYDVEFTKGKRTLDSTEIVPFRLFTLDGYTPLSPVCYMRKTIGTALAAQEHGGRLFANSARPGGILSTDKSLSKEAAVRLRGDVEEIVGGRENANRLLVLGEGMKWTQMGMTSDDAQWLESRKFSRSEIAGVFRVPPHLIADLERATFSNIEQQDLNLLKHSIMPYLRRIEQRVRASLMSDADRKAGYYARFNQDALLRGDAKSRAEALAIRLDRGVISPNEWRELDDLNPREGGDEYLTPANMVVGAKPGAAEPADPVDPSDPEDHPPEPAPDPDAPA
jgi:HK97 family phage portal protein